MQRTLTARNFSHHTEIKKETNICIYFVFICLKFMQQTKNISFAKKFKNQIIFLSFLEMFSYSKVAYHD